MIAPAPTSLALLAQQEIIDGIRTGMRAKPDGSGLLIFGLVAVALAALLVLATLCGYRRRKPKSQPDYFAAAANILNLTDQERADLERLAARARYSQPVAMLLSPANLAHAIERGLPDGNNSGLRRRLQTLSLKLFAQPAPTPQPGQHTNP